MDAIFYPCPFSVKRGVPGHHIVWILVTLTHLSLDKMAANVANNKSNHFLNEWKWENWTEFLPEASFGLRVLSLPASVRPSVSPSVTKFVRAITHYPFKQGSPNWDQRCKRPWLRSLLFCGTIDCDLQGQIELQTQNLPHFELVHAITHHQLQLQFPNLEQKMHLSTVQIPTNFGLDWNWSSIQFLI